MRDWTQILEFLSGLPSVAMILTVVAAIVAYRGPSYLREILAHRRESRKLDAEIERKRRELDARLQKALEVRTKRDVAAGERIEKSVPSGKISGRGKGAEP